METQTQNNQTSTSNEERIRKVSNDNALEVSRVYKGTYDGDGEETAELKQKIVTKSYYPTKQIKNDRQDNIFGMSDFGDTHSEKEFVNEETRVAWINVPEGTSVEQVKERLAKFPKARLYKVLANKPILTDNQMAAIQAGITTKEVFAERQAVEYPETPETVENGTAGKLILDKTGKVQYRAVFFSTEGKADEDLRTEDPSDFYITENLRAKLDDSAHVVSGQRI